MQMQEKYLLGSVLQKLFLSCSSYAAHKLYSGRAVKSYIQQGEYISIWP